jgi:hypothetical protein
MRTTPPYRLLASAECEEVGRGRAQGTDLSAIARRWESSTAFRLQNGGRAGRLEYSSSVSQTSLLVRTLCLSHEALYRASTCSLAGSLKTTLMRHCGKCAPPGESGSPESGNHEASRYTLAERLSIEVRPREVSDRTMPGPREPKDPAQ